MLIPHEHGAYGQLGFPVAAVLVAGHVNAGAALLTVACAAAFVAYEPMLVLLGQRGARARRESAGEARRTLVCSLALGLLTGAAGLWYLAPLERWTLLVPATFGAAAVALVVLKVHKTTAGELLVAIALSSCALPVGVAAGLSVRAAVGCAVVFAGGFCAATFAVRSTIALQRRERAGSSRVAAIAVAIASPVAVAVFSNLSGVDRPLWIAAAPLSMLAVALAARPPSARHLRRVGWALVGASAAATIALAVLMRH